jgi:RNAse (barnase) inhibitor barstar
MRRALDALARGDGNPGGALHRRQINTFIYGVDTDGATAKVIESYLRGSVTGVRASAQGDGLLDVTLDDAVSDPMPPGAREIWQLWHAGRPATAGLWSGYDSELRHQWLGAALGHHRHDAPDKPAGGTYHLDGRDVTDIEGFYCAIGEAINGPGGYFGWNLDALNDCLRGRWGAATPFRLIWPDSEAASIRLGRRHGDLLQVLSASGIDVEFR